MKLVRSRTGLANVDYLAKTGGRDASPEYLLSNSFGFGGINASLLFRRV